VARAGGWRRPAAPRGDGAPNPAAYRAPFRPSRQAGRHASSFAAILPTYRFHDTREGFPEPRWRLLAEASASATAVGATQPQIGLPSLEQSTSCRPPCAGLRPPRAPRRAQPAVANLWPKRRETASRNHAGRRAVRGRKPAWLLAIIVLRRRGVCIPPASPDLDCVALAASGIALPVQLVGGDPHHLDDDGDGS